MMAPVNLTDTVYLVCRLLLSAFAVAAAANAIDLVGLAMVDGGDNPFPGVHLVPR